MPVFALIDDSSGSDVVVRVKDYAEQPANPTVNTNFRWLSYVAETDAIDPKTEVTEDQGDVIEASRVYRHYKKKRMSAAELGVRAKELAETTETDQRFLGAVRGIMHISQRLLENLEAIRGNLENEGALSHDYTSKDIEAAMAQLKQSWRQFEDWQGVKPRNPATEQQVTTWLEGEYK